MLLFSNFLCNTQAGKFPLRTPFQNFSRPRKPRLTSETRLSDTKNLRGKRFSKAAPRLMAPHTRSCTIDRIRRATSYLDTHALVEKQVLTRLHLHVPLQRGRWWERTSRSKRKHGLNKNTVAYCASQTGVRAALADMSAKQRHCVILRCLIYEHKNGSTCQRWLPRVYKTNWHFQRSSHS
jgi:hypothetical protein